MSNFVSPVAPSADFLPYISSDITLSTAQTFVPITRSICNLKLYSDSKTASDRNLIIGPGEIEGQQLTLCMESGDIGPDPSTLLLSTISASYMRLVTSWAPILYDKLQLIWINGTWEECYRTETSSAVFTPVITAPVDAQVLIYDSGDTSWKNQSLSQNVTIDNTGISTLHVGNSSFITSASVDWISSANARHIVGTELAVLEGFFTCTNNTTDNFGVLPVGYIGSFVVLGTAITGGGGVRSAQALTTSGNQIGTFNSSYFPGDIIHVDGIVYLVTG